MPDTPRQPYESLPDRQYWARAVSRRSAFDISEIYRKKFSLTVDDGVATAGSCFAQHIAGGLSRAGYRFLNYEPSPPQIPADQRRDYGYGIYSARYGNVYTTRQLLQLAQRAFGAFTPVEQVWTDDETGRAYDPFRPTVEPDGFESVEEALVCQERHLATVRRLFTEMDVFVFTLGMTEAWADRRDGAVYPVCPGAAAGRYDPARHVFMNFDYEEVLSDLREFIALCRGRRADMRFIFTVSPVSIIATAEDEHVMVANTASKSVLRAVADRLTRDDPLIDYFPGYELVTGAPFRSMYHQPDLREVTRNGVDWVMSHFLAEHPVRGPAKPAAAPPPPEERDVACDEEYLVRQSRRREND